MIINDFYKEKESTKKGKRLRKETGPVDYQETTTRKGDRVLISVFLTLTFFHIDSFASTESVLLPRRPLHDGTMSFTIRVS